MSIELDPREVLQCLNELGYYNINTKQLKEFLKDLKTLIKHDIKKLTDENQENIHPYSNRYELPHKTYNSYYINNYNNNNEHDKIDGTKLKTQLDGPKFKTQQINPSEVFDHLYSTSTISSRAKSLSTPKHNSIISIDIRKVKRHSEPVIPLKTRHESTKNTGDKVSHTNDPKSDVDTKTSITNTNLDSKSVSTNKDCCCVRTEITNKKVNTLKPKVSFIKPQKPVKVSKSDPVSLYQHYQKEWKKQKLPGEDKRYDLRWAIRERMLSEPEIPVHSLDKLKKSSRF